METLKSFEDRAAREAAFAAYEALALELRQMRSIERQAQDLERSIAGASATIDAAEKAVRAAYDEQLRGLATADDVLQARSRVSLAQHDLAKDRDQLSQARQSREDADARIRAAKAVAQRARDAQSSQLFAAIAAAIHSDDGKLRRRLLLAFTAVRLTNDSDVGVVGRPNWYGLLEEIFPPPTDEELEAVSADAGGRFPRLADVAEAVAA